MAKNFFEIGRLGRSQPTAIDYSEGLQPALDDLKARLDESKLKRDTLLSQMPTGVAIEKVPEVFRGKVTEFLTQNRQQYIEASKVIASGLRPDDERYIGAMNTINSVRLRFDNLSNDLELYATTRKESLNQTNASLGVKVTLQNDHNNLASGEMTKTLAINEDGNITYVNDAGSVGLFKDDFKLNYQAETSFQTTVSEVRAALRDFKRQKGATYESVREDSLNAFDTFFNNTTIDGIRHAMFSDKDFMQDYIKKSDPNFNFEDETAVENKIRGLVETENTDELKKAFKEFYTGKNGEFETYFNKQPGYEPPTEKVSNFYTNFKNQQDLLYKTLNEDDYKTIINTDFLNSQFSPGKNFTWIFQDDKYVLFDDVRNFQVTSFDLEDSQDQIRQSINVGLMKNSQYSGFNYLQNQDPFKTIESGDDEDDDTENETNVYDAFNTRSDVWRQNDISYDGAAEREGQGNKAELFIKNKGKKVNIKLIKPGADKLKLTNPKNMGNFIRFFRAVNNTYQSGNYSMPENFGTINVKDFGYNGEVNDKGQPQDMNDFVKFVIDIFRGSELWGQLSGSNDKNRIDNLIVYLENYEKTNNIINDYKVN